MARIENVEKVKAVLRARAARAQQESNTSVVVGYSAGYALYVHENLEAKHPVGQAKFLEQPARELAGEFAEIIRTAMKRGASLAQGLLLAGLRLQRASQLLVPVDTGALKASAFTRLEGGTGSEVAAE